MRKFLFGALLAMGLGLAQFGEVMTPSGLPTPIGPYWKKLAPEECQAAWKAFKEEAKGASLTGLEGFKEVRCLYFEKGSKNAPLGWEMGNKTLSQVFLEGWEKHKDTFRMLADATGRAKGIVTFQPTARSFVALVLGFKALEFLPRFDVVYALERENDVVLIEPFR